ncbi:hypothetical protein [Rhodoferax ferrireducens]|uniref:hypothetical protein n=1 Tax=Rhodoferax ferrireducens TaxID=192843 RepID=UPI000E0D48B4|nr:hypothetical protein [Rhodoferax ferrireducens]
MIRPINSIFLTLVLTLAFAVALSAPKDDGRSAAADAAIAENHDEIKALRAAIDMCGGPDVVAEKVSKGVYRCLEEETITAGVEK